MSPKASGTKDVPPGATENPTLAGKNPGEKMYRISPAIVSSLELWSRMSTRLSELASPASWVATGATRSVAVPIVWRARWTTCPAVPTQTSPFETAIP
jgi:hypothetical protein